MRVNLQVGVSVAAIEQETTAEATCAVQLRIRSQIPGRIRWQVPQLRGAVEAASRVESLLLAVPEVTEVRANPVTGCVLVLFHPQLAVEVLVERLADAVASGLELGMGQAPPEVNPALRTGLLVTGGALVASSVVLLALGSSALAAFTVGALGVATTAAGRAQPRAPTRREPTTSTRSWLGVLGLGRLADEVQPYRGRLLLVGTLAVATVLATLAKFVCIGLAINHVIGVVLAPQAVAGASLYSPLVFFILLSLVATAFQGLFMYWGQVTTEDIAQNLQHDLRVRAYHHIQQAPIPYFDGDHRSRVVSTLSHDINQIEHIFFAGWEGSLVLAGCVVLCVFYYIVLSPMFASLMVLALPFVVWGLRGLHARSQPLVEAKNDDEVKLRSALHESFDGLATIKSFTAEGEELGRIANLSRAYADSTRGANEAAAIYRPIFEEVVMLVTGLTVLAGAMAVSGGLSIGLFFLVIMGTRQLLVPAAQLGRIFEMAQRGVASAHRVLDLLEVEPEDVDRGVALTKDSVRGDLRFESVVFSYDSEAPVLRGLDLEIPAGKTTAIVGPTGCGKSTLLQLVMRFYEPKAGHIYLDGRPLAEFKLRDLRAAVAFVTQDIFFFDGTIAENIKFACPEADFDTIRSAAYTACADEFIAEQARGYDTAVGGRGLKLSGGERQRLAIARALLKDAPILVLDEATSSVDNQTQAIIQNRLDQVSNGRTTVIIAHRLSTITNADLIYVLVDGRVVQQGTHDQLVAEDGLYAHLWALQLTSEDAA